MNNRISKYFHMLYIYILYPKHLCICMHLPKNQKNNEKTFKEKRLGYYTCIIKFKVFLNVIYILTLYNKIEFVLNRK